ncbi:unnamed protein product [Sphagnum tenellum]
MMMMMASAGSTDASADTSISAKAILCLDFAHFSSQRNKLPLKLCALICKMLGPGGSVLKSGKLVGGHHV